MKNVLLSALCIGMVCEIGTLGPNLATAQVGDPLAAPTTLDAQRNALNNVRTQVKFFAKSTRTAQNLATGANEMVWEKLQAVRGAFTSFRATLNPQELVAGANELAELDDGLGVMQAALSNNPEIMNAGTSSPMALRNTWRALDRSAKAWLLQFNKDSARIRSGRL